MFFRGKKKTVHNKPGNQFKQGKSCTFGGNGLDCIWFGINRKNKERTTGKGTNK